MRKKSVCSFVRLFVCSLGILWIGYTEVTFAADTTIKGTGATSATAGLEVTNSSDTSLLYVRNDGNVGIGTTAPGTRLEVKGDGANPGIKVNGAGAVGLRVDYFNATYPSDYYGTVSHNGNVGSLGGGLEFISQSQNASEAGASIAFGSKVGAAAAVPRMLIRYDGNVGIGTTGPGYKLDVNGKAAIRDQILIADSPTTNPGLAFVGETNTGFSYRTTGTVQYWSQGNASIQFGAGGVQTRGDLQYTWTDGTNVVNAPLLGLTSYYNGSAYTNTLKITNGSTGGTGSLMTPIIYGGSAAGSTLTLAGTINGSPSNAHIILNGNGQGNVGIGTTGPQALLNVGNGNIRVDATAQVYNEGLTLNAPTDMATPYVGINIQSVARGAAFSASGSKWLMFYNYTPEGGLGSPAGGLGFIQANTNTRLFINSSGNVGIGTTGPGAKLSVVGADSLNTSFAGNISGATGTGLVITNAGNVGIGTTAPTNGKLVVIGGVTVGADAANNTFNTASGGTGSTTMYIGNATINVTASDRRMKEDIAPSKINGLELLKKMQVIDFDWKKGNKWRDRGRATGLIAQEVVKYLPQVVNKPDDPKNMWTVEYQHIVPYLIKAVQEQQVEIEALKARIAALEAREK